MVTNRKLSLTVHSRQGPGKGSESRSPERVTYLTFVIKSLTLLQLVSPGSCQNGPLFVRGSGPGSLYFPNSIPYPIVFHNAITTQSTTNTRSVSSVVDEAVGLVDDEDATMRRRLQQGIDRYPQDFVNPDPLLFSESPDDPRSFSRQSRIINWIARLLRKYGLEVSLATALLNPAARRHSLSCPYKPPINCERFTRYRTVDGSCNNLNSPLWGAAFTPFVRLLPPRYERRGDRDDVMSGPSSTLSSHLPTARVVSTTYHEPARGGDDAPFTMLLTVFGQFLSHDLTDRAPTKGLREQLNQASSFIDGGAIYGATKNKSDSLRQFKGACGKTVEDSVVEYDVDAPVYRSDPRWDQIDRRVRRLGLDRSPHHNIPSTESVHLSDAVRSKTFMTSSVDTASTITSSEAVRWRSRLLMMSVPRELPIMPHGNVHATTRGFAYYAAGDNRVNEFIGLIAIETMWVREHNRIATKLATINPHWNDETVFQETRRIVVAMIQHITYSEYLPAVLGPELMGKYELGVLPNGRYREYDPRVNPGLANAFATAAMRFGHSMLRTTFSMIDRQRKRNGDTPVDLKDSFFRPQTYLTNENPFVRGMALDSSKMCDRVVSGSVINNLYETEPGNGADLAASNIQRGRDHGLPEYAQWRRHFGLSVPTRFDKSLAGFSDINAADVEILSTLYRSPSDVDLFTGGVSEDPVQQGAVGPLFGDIIGQQFKTLKMGDRFWYETNLQPQAFTEGKRLHRRK
ncbi:peroxidasin-like [Liolophura sinensis]|uniref:peroxidasin-like n=1 Tax=Liolophura sinensis TaxID=3198878 RepID=UPI0031597ED5